MTAVRVDGSDEIAKELGELIELRELELCLVECDESVCNSLMVSIGKLHKLQSLTIFVESGTMFDVSPDGWVPPPLLRTLEFHHCTSTLPRWINSSSPLPLLSTLHIRVDEVRWEDIQILGKLPNLCDLVLATAAYGQYILPRRFSIRADAFPRVTECSFMYFTTVPSMFPRGAMPRLEVLMFCARALDIANGELDMSMGHLPSLRRVEAILWPEEDRPSALEEARDALTRAADDHPNRPSVSINLREPIYNGESEEEEYDESEEEEDDESEEVEHDESEEVEHDESEEEEDDEPGPTKKRSKAS